MGDEFGKIRLAAAQVAPVFLDREATVEKACDYIRQAGAEGADVIGFPEGFIPAHPSWYSFQPMTTAKSMKLAARLFKNAVVIPGPDTDKLRQACREAQVTAVIGVCEKRPETTGTMYNTQLFIGPDGRILGKHQKLVPTVGERLVHTGGWGDTLHAYPAPFGNISGLICGENSNPLAQYALLTEHTVVHVASWPPHFGLNQSMENAIMTSGRGVAYTLGAFVINAPGVVTDAMIEAYAETEADNAVMEGFKETGAASIINPMGSIVAGPMEAGEGILYADVDLDQVLSAKLLHDFSGHYNRFDVFTVNVNRHAPKPLNSEPGERAWSDPTEQDAELDADPAYPRPVKTAGSGD